MRFNLRLAGVTLTVLSLLMGAGCTPSKVLAPSNGQVALQMLVDPAVGPRDGSKPAFVWAKTRITAVTFSPVDESAATSLGPNPLQILLQASDVDLAVGDAQPIATVNIGPGTYRIGQIFINFFELNTSNEPPVAQHPRCAGGALEYAQILPVGGGAAPIDPALQPVFEVRAGKQTTLRLVASGTELTTLLESQVTCAEDGIGATVAAIPLAALGSKLSFQLP
jgi:hypothetical protein